MHTKLIIGHKNNSNATKELVQRRPYHMPKLIPTNLKMNITKINNSYCIPSKLIFKVFVDYLILFHILAYALWPGISGFVFENNTNLSLSTYLCSSSNLSCYSF